MIARLQNENKRSNTRLWKGYLRIEAEVIKVSEFLHKMCKTENYKVLSLRLRKEGTHLLIPFYDCVGAILVN